MGNVRFAHNVTMYTHDMWNCMINYNKVENLYAIGNLYLLFVEFPQWSHS